MIVNEVLVAEKEINNKFKRNNIRKELRELLNSMSSKEISTFKTKIVNNENITDLILIKAKEIGASDSIRDIQLIDDHAIKEIMKGLIKDA